MVECRIGVVPERFMNAEARYIVRDVEERHLLVSNWRDLAEFIELTDEFVVSVRKTSTEKNDEH